MPRGTPPWLCCENPPEHGASRTRERQNTGLPRTRDPEHGRTRGVLLRSAFICVQPEHSCVLLRSGPSCVLLRSVICVPAQNTDPAFCQNTAAFSCVLGSCVLLRSAFCCVLDPAFCWVLGLGLELVLCGRLWGQAVGAGWGSGLQGLGLELVLSCPASSQAGRLWGWL